MYSYRGLPYINVNYYYIIIKQMYGKQWEEYFNLILGS